MAQILVFYRLFLTLTIGCALVDILYMVVNFLLVVIGSELACSNCEYSQINTLCFEFFVICFVLCLKSNWWFKNFSTDFYSLFVSRGFGTHNHFKPNHITVAPVPISHEPVIQLLSFAAVIIFVYRLFLCTYIGFPVGIVSNFVVLGSWIVCYFHVVENFVIHATKYII